MLLITKDYDEFKGLTTISTSIVCFPEFNCFAEAKDFFEYYISSSNSVESKKESEIKLLSHAFNMSYLELDSGAGDLQMYVFTIVNKGKASDLPKLEGKLYLLIDGERASIAQAERVNSSGIIEVNRYTFTVDVLMLICKAEIVKYSFRGINGEIEGSFTPQHIETFKAFQALCFGDESEGRKIIASLNDIQNNKIIEQEKDLAKSREDLERISKENEKIYRVNSYFEINKKYLEENKINMLKERLLSLDDSIISNIIENESKSFKKLDTVLILSICGGWLGIDRFFIGDVLQGFIKLATFGGCGIWYFIDWFLIMTRTRKLNTNKLLHKLT